MHSARALLLGGTSRSGSEATCAVVLTTNMSCTMTLISKHGMRKCNVHIFSLSQLTYSQVRHWKRGIDSCHPIMAESAAKPSSDAEVEGLSSSSETSEDECIRRSEFIL